MCDKQAVEDSKQVEEVWGGGGGLVKEEILFLRSLQDRRLAPVTTTPHSNPVSFSITLFSLGRLGVPKSEGNTTETGPYGEAKVQMEGTG